MDRFINHYGAVRIRVTGTGNLRMKFLSYDEEYTQDLIPIPMLASTSRTPTQLANFSHQSAKLRIEVNEINESFVIGQILVYVKPIATSFPQ